MKTKFFYCLLGVSLSISTFFIISYLLTGSLLLKRKPSDSDKLGNEMKKRMILQNKHAWSGGNIFKRSFYDMTQNFEFFYKSGNTNSNYSNDSISIPIKYIFELINGVPNEDNINNFLATMVINQLNNSWSKGLNLAYTLDSVSNNGGLSFSYVLYKSHRNPGLLAISGTKYLRVIKNVIHIEPSTPGNFEIIKNNYFNSVEVNRFSSITRDGINALYNGTNDSCHPKNCFYDFQSIYKFFMDNREEIADPITGTLFSGINLHIINGAIYLHVEEPSPDDYKIQTPLIVLKRGSKLLLSDTIYSATEPFRRNALDIGLLCPPDCPK